MLGEDKPPLEELMHYGVKGMRWGVRRSQKQLERSQKQHARGDRKSAKASKAARKGKTEKAAKNQAKADKAYSKSEKNLKRSMVTPEQRIRRAKVGAAAAASVLAVGGAVAVKAARGSSAEPIAKKIASSTDWVGPNYEVKPGAMKTKTFTGKWKNTTVDSSGKIRRVK